MPAYQVKEFAPGLTFGGSASRAPLVALALSDTWSRDHGLLDEAPNNAVYYTSIRSTGTGLVRAVPGFDAPAVGYRLTRRDLDLLRSGLGRLLHLLLAAGAGAAGAVLPRCGRWCAARPTWPPRPPALAGTPR